MNITLTPELESFIETKVNSGMYASASEVIRDALRSFSSDHTKGLKTFLASRVIEAEQEELLEVDFNDIISEAKKEKK